MRIGVAAETKVAEGRVALTPAGTRELTARGHEVLVESGAGARSGFPDSSYRIAGATLADTLTVWERSELLLKVKEPLPHEYDLLRPDLTLFTYLHLAAEPALTEALRNSGVTAIAYETVTEPDGSLPLLAPMSEIAGRLAAQVGAYFMLDQLGGSGTLIGGAPGVAPARVLVIGGGAVGTAAAKVAIGMGAEVTVLDRDLRQIRHLEEYLDGRARVLCSDEATLAEELATSELVIGAVLVPGARAPHLISEEMLAEMRDGSVIVDVAIDQGGCSVASHPTTHEDPVFAVDGIVHYCVANMPGAVPATSTRALTNSTMPYVLRLADRGVEAALETSADLAAGLNVIDGAVVHPAIVSTLEVVRT